MRKVFITLFASLLILIPNTVYAQDSLPKPGLTPNSPFYFLDKVGEYFNLLFTFNKDKKLEKELQFAEERLAELDLISNNATEEKLTTLRNEYENKINYLENKEDLPNDIKERIEIKKESHLQVLEQIQRKVAQDYQDIFTDIISRYQDGEITKEQAQEEIKEVKEEIVEEVQAKEESNVIVPKTDTVVKTPKVTESVTQVARITSPTKDAKKRFTPSSYTSVTVKFDVYPNSNQSGLQKLALYVGNQEIYSTQSQNGSYVIPISMLNNPLNYVKVVANFNEKQYSSDLLIIDMSEFVSDSSKN